MSAVRLHPGGWLPEVHAALQALLDRHGRGGPAFEAAAPPFAVFDWDQTITRFDIGDAVLAYQVEQQAFALHHPPFWDLLPQPLPPGLRAVAEAVAAAADAQPPPRPEQAALRAAILAGYLAAGELDPQEGFPWQTQILAGLRVAEVEALTERVIDRALRAPLAAVEHWPVEPSDDSRGLRIRWAIRPYPAMLDLIGALGRAGIDVWVVSASPVWVVRTFARRLGLPPERVIGTRTRVAADGTISHVVEPPVPATTGKVEAIKHYVHPRQRPVFVAGDNITDRPMLEYAADTRLVIDRGVVALREIALERRRRGERWLLQPAFELEDDAVAGPASSVSVTSTP